MEFLPIQIIVKILSYIPIRELYQSLIYIKKIRTLLLDNSVQKQLLSIYYPKELVNKIIPNDYFLCLKTIGNKPEQEIPFWGVETNAGIWNNSLRYWIGKSFMSTNQPQVALCQLKDAYITGVLAVDYISLAQSLIDYNRYYVKYVKNQIEEEYNSSEDELELINHENEIQLENISIFDTFRSLYRFQQDVECVQQLYQYAQNMSELIHSQSYSLDKFDNQYEKLEKVISYIKKIKINRNTQFNLIIKTIMIFSSEYYIDEIPINTDCKSVAQLINIIQNQEYIPQNSNIQEIIQKYGLVSNTENNKDVLYCTFKPKDHIQPLLWLSFINPTTMNFSLKLQDQAQRKAKCVQIRIQDVEYQEEYQENAISFAYISLSGLTLKEDDLGYFQYLPN